MDQIFELFRSILGKNQILVPTGPTNKVSKNKAQKFWLSLFRI